MRVKFYCDSGANIKSERSEIIDVENDLGMSEEEWKGLSDDEKYEMASDWAWDRLSIGWEELD